MRPSEKCEAKAAGQKGSPEAVCSTLRTFLADNAGIGLPLGIERVIGIGSKPKVPPHAQITTNQTLFLFEFLTFLW